QIQVPFVTLTSPGATATPRVTARFSDGTSAAAGTVPGTVFTSSDPSVVAVDGSGTLTAQGEGTATVAIANGAVHASIEVASEFRTPPDISALHLAPFPEAVSVDQAEVQATATLVGTG